MQKDPQEELDQFFRDAGKQLEAAMRNSGTPLPEGMSGEEFVRLMMAETQRVARTPEARVRTAQMRAIIEQVAAELPGGYQDPQFDERMRARIKEITGENDGGSIASA